MRSPENNNKPEGESYMEQNNQIQKKVPHDADAEQAVLSSILMYKDAAAEAF